MVLLRTKDVPYVHVLKSLLSFAALPGRVAGRSVVDRGIGRGHGPEQEEKERW